MDERGAINYHHRHLIADVFGQWVAWWLLARRQAADDEKLSMNHFALQQKENFIFKLKLGVYVRHKKDFGTILSLTMEDLLLMRKGMRGFETFLSKRLGSWDDREQRVNNALQYNRRRFLKRLKEKTMSRLKSSISRRFRLNDVSSSKLRASAQKVMDKLLVLMSVQTKQREQLQKSRLFWASQRKRCSLRK